MGTSRARKERVVLTPHDCFVLGLTQIMPGRAVVEGLSIEVEVGDDGNYRFVRTIERS